MSKTIDERVVQMKFDNSHFEKNVSQTMSTLEKFKQKLNLSGATKGLEEVNRSAKNVDMSGLSKGVETVQAKFSAMEVVGVTALMNITNSAVEAGKRFISALTVAPVSDGWREYEMTLNAVQTTMAGTGKTAAEVEKELKKLDDYADKTVYSTADMLNNLPKFTNAGVELENATKAMIGIANATALAGGDANKASIAFYNLGQAIGTGYLTRMDYNSINNAGIATMEWKNQMVEAAIAAGTLKKAGNDMYKVGKKTMTINQLFIDGLQEQWATTEVMMKVFEDYGDETTEIGKKAYSAAQDIKTFTMMMDSLKATAGTGWKDTWQIIFGDLDEAKELWTGLTNFLSNIITKMADFRNNLLEGALSFNPFTLLLEKLDNSLLGSVTKKVTQTSKTLEYYQDMVNKVWRGDYKNQPYRYGLLEAEGHDHRTIQSLVNMGYQYKITLEDVVEVEKKYGITVENIADATEDRAKALENLTDEQLRAMGLTEDEIKLFRDLEKQSKKTGISIEDLLKAMSEKSGRTLLLESFANVGKSLVQVFGALKEAWLDAFPAPTSTQLYNLIASFHNLTEKLTMSDETFDRLKRTLKGVLAFLDLFISFFATGIRIAFAVFKAVLTLFDLDILRFTAILGDAAVAVRNWVEDHNLLRIALQKFVKVMGKVLGEFREWVLGSDKVQKALAGLETKLRAFKKTMEDWWAGLKKTDNIGAYLIEGLINGIQAGFGMIRKVVVVLATLVIDVIKAVLGIHSPSTEFFEIGQNIIAGFVNGIKAGFSLVFGLIKGFGEIVIGLLAKIDFGKLLAAGIGIGMIVVISKMLNLISAIAAPLTGFGDMLEEIGDGFKAIGKGVKNWGTGKMIESIAKSIAILVASIVVLTFIDPGELWAAIGAIAALAAILGVLTFVASKVDNLGDMGKLSLMILGMSTSLLLMAFTFKMLAGIKPEQMLTVIKGFSAMIIGMIALVAAFGLLVKSESAKYINKVGGMVAKISFALLMLVAVVKLASMISGEDLLKGMTVITLLGAFMGALMFVAQFAGENAKKAGQMISKISFALLMMLIVIKFASMLEGEEILKGMVVIGMLGLFFIALIDISKYAGANATKAGGMLLMMSVALAIMVGVLKQVSDLSLWDIAKSIPVVALFGVFCSALIKVTKDAGPNAIKAGAMLLMISGAILILTGVIFLLSKMDAGGIYKALGVVSVLELLMMGLIKATKDVPSKIMGTLVTITVAIGILVAAIIGLSFIDPTRLAAASASIAAVLGTLALLINSTKAIGNVGKVALTLLSLIGVVAAISGIMILLSKFAPGTSIEAAASISLLLATMSVSLMLLSFMGPQALLGVGALALLTLVVGGLAAMLGVMESYDIAPSMAVAKALSTLLLAMSASLVILGVVGAMGPAPFIGLAALAALIVGLDVIIIAIGALMNKFPMMQKFLDTGIVVLEKIGYAIGSFVGNIVGGFLTGATANLPVVGKNLSDFMTNVTGFIEGAKLVDGSVVKGIGNLALAIVALSAASLIEGITSFLTFGSSFAGLGKELSAFMTNAMPFIENSSKINAKAMEGVRNIAEAIGILTKADIMQGLTSWLTGGSSIADFGEDIAGLGTSMNKFATNLGTFGDDKAKTVECACTALKALAEAADTIPNEGGLWSALVGENSLATFGDQLPGLATNLNGFMTNLGTFDDAKVKVVDCAGQAIKALAEAAAEIPNQGGLWSMIVGDNSLATFGGQLPGLGTNLNKFISNLGTFDEARISTVECACAAIKGLAEAADTIPNEGGLWAALVGDNSLATFGGQLPGLATHIKNFVKNLGTFSDGQVTTVTSACKAIETIAKLGDINIKSTGNDLESLGKNMVKFAKKVKDFAKELGKVTAESITGAINKTQEIVTMASSVADINIDSLKTFGDSLKKVAKTGVSGFVKEFSGFTPKEDAKKAGKALLDAVIDGISSKKKSVEKEAKTVAEAGVNKMKSKELKDNATAAGKDLVTGFANGIKNNKSLAENAGSELGKAALAAAKEAIDSNSPSKEAEKLGNFFGQGLVIGIRDYGLKSYDAGYSVADQAKKGLSAAIAKVSNLINSDMDAEPTIRPVLDLSNVESGMSSLSSMFNNGPSLGVMSNINAISSGMNARSQNGPNSDVVSSLDKLRRDLSNLPKGDTYNVNGVTYDDGSNIRDAVETIVRAAILERRS